MIFDIIYIYSIKGISNINDIRTITNIEVISDISDISVIIEISWRSITAPSFRPLQRFKFEFDILSLRFSCAFCN